jgi:hypothetical protein
LRENLGPLAEAFTRKVQGLPGIGNNLPHTKVSADAFSLVSNYLRFKHFENPCAADGLGIF